MSTHDVRIAEIITPIRKADAVSFDASRADLRKKFAASEHNRLLVYKNATSNIVGYIEICQLLNKARPCPDLSDLVKPILTLTSDLPVTAALNQLKNNNQRIALVVSERNKKILGLVTRKDLIEEFLGEMTTI